MPSVVYFVEVLEKQRNPNVKIGDIKIGTTTDYQSRFYDIQRQYGKMRLVALMEGGQPEEHGLHQRFHLYRRKRTEFFAPGEGLLDFIDRLPPATIPLPLSKPIEKPLKAWWFRVPK